VSVLSLAFDLLRPSVDDRSGWGGEGEAAVRTPWVTGAGDIVATRPAALFTSPGALKMCAQSISRCITEESMELDGVVVLELLRLTV
jgi:hypothetical protein